MKVCIVTVYNSINSGSFWQAKALGVILERIGMDVFYLKRKNNARASSSNINKFTSIIKRFLKDGLSSAKNQYNIFKDFELCQKEFNVIKNKSKIFDQIDCFILGSDTIWNLDDKFFSTNYKIYFGGIFNNKKVISYGASIGNTSLETIRKYLTIPKMLEKIKFISVRDEETYSVIKELSLKPVKLVCDPTLLLTKGYYKSVEPIPREKGYIFLYLFSKLSLDQIDEIRRFANRKSLKIIDGIRNKLYCDYHVVNSPYTFLNYMLYADYIITDTYHGVVFSTNLEKEFICINRKKKKVSDFLERVDLKDRLVNDDDITSKFLTKTVFHSDKIQRMRVNSLKFLKRALGEE